MLTNHAALCQSPQQHYPPSTGLSEQTQVCLARNAERGGKNVFCSKKINFDFTVFLYANLPYFLKTNGGSWREHFPAESSHLFYPNRMHCNQKTLIRANVSMRKAIATW